MESSRNAVARTVRFGVIGPLDVQGPEGPINVSPGKQRAVLALLVLNANEVISRDRLVGELWGTPPPNSVKALQMHISHLRRSFARALGEQAARSLLATRSPGYVVQLQPDDLDLTRFEAAFREARRALDAGDPARAHALVTEGLALWRGPPLADLELRAIRARGDRPPAGAARGGAGAAHRGRPRARPPQPARRRAGGAGPRAPAQGAPARPADALPVPLRAARPRRSRATRRRAARWSRSSGSSPADSCASSTKRSSARTRDSTRAGGRVGRTRRPAARSWAAFPSSPSSWPVSMMPSPAADACFWSSVSPASARAASPKR